MDNTSHADRLQVCRNITENIINKGEISQAFNHSDKMLFPKTGQEIKTAVDALIVVRIAKLQANCDRLIQLSEVIVPKPNEETYVGEDAESILKVCPFVGMKYGYKMCYLDSNLDNRIVPSGMYGSQAEEGQATTKQEAENCDEYNKLISSCISVVKDMNVLKTLKQNVKDKEVYQLTMEQVKSLNTL